MYKEQIGKMELHVTHELSFRALPRGEYAVRDYSSDMPYSTVAEIKSR